MKHVGIFNDGFPPVIDGVTQTILNYVDWLQKKGEHPCVVTPYNPQTIEVDYPVIRYFSLPIQSRHPYRYGYPKLDFKIWKKLRSTPFKIIHSHSPFAAGRLGVYAKRKQNVPLIGTFHSKYRSDLKHSFRYMPFCVPIIMSRILNFYNACDEVWIPQASVEETLREYGYRGKIEVVENGIDYADIDNDSLKEIKTAAKKEIGLDNNSLHLLFVGQHIWEKGIRIILDSLIILKNEGIDFSMTFIGDGYAKNELISLIDGAGLRDKVTTLDTIVDREALKKHYAASDIFLFPSRYDNAPLVVREAAAMGTPSIIPLGSTASEVIEDNFNGFLADDDAAGYANTIMKINGNRDIIVKTGENAKATLVRDWNNVMEEVADRYNHLISRFNGEKILY